MIDNNGTYNQFTWHFFKKDIRPHVIYELYFISYIVNRHITDAKLVNYSTGAVTSLTRSNVSYDVEGVTLQRCKISGSVPTSGLYYIEMDGLYSDLISFNDCGLYIEASNDCDDLHYRWSSDSYPVYLSISNAKQRDDKKYESETIEIVTETGTKTLTKKFKEITIVEALLPIGYYNVLNGITSSTSVKINNTLIKNIKVNKEDINTSYAKFTIEFQYLVPENKSACCEEVNLDSIIISGSGGGNPSCVDYEVEITNTAGTLEAVATGVVGTSIYKWYRNGQYLSSGDTLVTNGVYGSYKVEATNTGCFTTATIYLSDPCDAMSIEAFVVNNVINASIENEISGTTYSVKLNGTEVTTSLPYTALASGVYFIHATKDNCKKVAGVYVTLTSNDCAFTIDIDVDGNNLTVDTNAVDPYTVEWEKEDSTGRNVISTAETIAMNGHGIYFLTVTKGSCSKEDYHYNYNYPTNNFGQPKTQTFTGVTGTSFEVTLFDPTPSDWVMVYRNGVKMTLNATPTIANQFKWTGVNLVLSSDFPLEADEIIEVIKIYDICDC